MVSRKWTCQLSLLLTLPMLAAMPPSAMTVCALPNRDLQMTATRIPASRARSPRFGATGTDDEDVVLVALDLGRGRVGSSVGSCVEAAVRQFTSLRSVSTPADTSPM